MFGFNKQQKELLPEYVYKIFVNDREQAEGSRAKIIRESPERYDGVLEDIRKTVGFKEVGFYTTEDALDYIETKYAAKTISTQDFFDLSLKLHDVPLHSVKQPLKYVTRGGADDKKCVVKYKLPKQEISNICGDADSVLLAIEAKHDKITSWWMGYNNIGYTDLHIALYIFKGLTFNKLAKLLKRVK